MILAVTLRVLFALCGPQTGELAQGAQRTAPTYLTSVSALEHARSAVIAGAVYDVDPALLLSIGWHESRYTPAARNAEAGRKTSCGVMTPEPLARCTTSTTLAGYLAGAQHLRSWIDAMHGNLHAALTGFAGGYALLQLCAVRDVRACHTPAIFLQRAHAIASAGPTS